MIRYIRSVAPYTEVSIFLQTCADSRQTPERFDFVAVFDAVEAILRGDTYFCGEPSPPMRRPISVKSVL